MKTENSERLVGAFTVDLDSYRGMRPQKYYCFDLLDALGSLRGGIIRVTKKGDAPKKAFF